MSIITSIQKRTGLLLVVILGALAAFVLTDLLTGASRMGSAQIIGEIDGMEVKYQDFNREVEATRAQMEANQGMKLNEAQLPMVRTQAWNKLVTEYALKPEWEKLGIIVTDEELVDMVQGNNISPQIKQAFSNPETGQFDKDQLVAFLKNLPSQPPEAQQQFAIFEQQLPLSRRSEKYENLLRKSVYITKAEAKRRYEDETTTLDLKYLYVPYANLPDSAVSITDEQIKSYYNEHKEDYDDLASAALEYVAIDIVPSKTDSMEVERYLKDIKSQFESTQNDTAFVVEHSQIQDNFAKVSYSKMPPAIKPASEDLVVVGTVSEPAAAQTTYKMFKIVEALGQVNDSVKANHILFKVQPNDTPAKKEEIKVKAQEILEKAKNGADFAALAKEHSEDLGNKEKGGDLSWFGRGAMVKPFEEAAFGAEKEGILPELVETRFGFHIIQITGLKKTNQYLIASVTRLLDPSEATRETLYRQAGSLAASKSISEYEAQVKEYNFISLQANNVKQNARSLNNIYDPTVRQAIRWAFDEQTKAGSVSNEVFEVDNKYLIMVLKSRTKKGIQPLSKVYDQVRRQVVKEAKIAKIKEQLAGKKGSLDEMAKEFGQQARVLSQQNYTYITQALQGVGFAPKTVGQAFGLKEGEMSEPIADETGMVIVQVEKRVDAAEVADYNKYKEPVIQDRQALFNQGAILRAIKQITDTEDNIDSFY